MPRVTNAYILFCTVLRYAPNVFHWIFWSPCVLYTDEIDYFYCPSHLSISCPQGSIPAVEQNHLSPATSRVFRRQELDACDGAIDYRQLKHFLFVFPHSCARHVAYMVQLSIHPPSFSYIWLAHRPSYCRDMRPLSNRTHCIRTVFIPYKFSRCPQHRRTNSFPETVSIFAAVYMIFFLPT